MKIFGLKKQDVDRGDENKREREMYKSLSDFNPTNGSRSKKIRSFMLIQ